MIKDIMKRNTLRITFSCLLVSGVVRARDLYVDHDKGVDTADALAVARVATSASGPVKTIARAVALARAGDTVHLAATERAYHDSINLHSRAGEPGRPIVIDGHGAVLTGCDPLRPADWQEAGPGLFRSDTLYAAIKGQPFIIDRVYFLFQGDMRHMGRTSKGPKAPFKKPADLQPGEWTFVEGENVFYVRIAPGQSLADAHIEIPYRLNGIAIHGKGNAHLMIRNLTATHFLNDGFNIHNESQDLRFENIRAVENGDDGFSAHETCQMEVVGLVAIGNSTGVCNIQQAVCKLTNVYLGGNHGYDFFGCQGTQFEIRNAIIDSSAAATPVVIRGHPKTAQTCRVTLDNVLIRYSGVERKRLEVAPNGVLEANRVTSVGLSWLVAGTVSAKESVIRGSPEAGLECVTGAVWKGENCVYDLARVRMEGRRFQPEEFLAYGLAAGQAARSRWQSFGSNQVERLLNGPGQAVPGIGADFDAIVFPSIQAGGMCPGALKGRP
jgi:hypothetical protein